MFSASQNREEKIVHRVHKLVQDITGRRKAKEKGLQVVSQTVLKLMS